MAFPTDVPFKLSMISAGGQAADSAAGGGVAGAG